jgi:rhamnogalacturonyl hydrolase YesR
MHLLRSLVPALALASSALAQILPPSSATMRTTPGMVPSSPSQLNPTRLDPAYPVPYEPASVGEIKAVLDRVLGYVEGATPIRIIDRETKQPVTDLSQLPANAGLERTDFMLTSYEWGVTYSGMLHVAAVTGDLRYRDYTGTRLHAIAQLATHLSAQPPLKTEPTGPDRGRALRQVIAPRSLDDSGAMAAAMIRTARAGVHADALRPWIDNYLRFITTSQFRLADGTLARNRPMPNSLWLDDLYMSVPALAQMGALTGDAAYFDDAVKQIAQFSARMFIPEIGLYRHGWVQEMEPHPAFHWGRANGWAIIAMAELLDVLPDNHPGRAAVLEQYRAHARGLAAVQGGTGLWHQLLDRNDSYLETSASAMFVYAIGHGINRGWLDAKAYGPMVSLGWNAVAQQVNATGQVKGTCVGTGMGFDPMFYYYRPTHVLAAHGYGPVLLAGAEMITLRQGKGADAVLHDGGIHFERATER